jgi:cytochrome c oxidase cbb3-type subunit 1
MVVAAFGLVFYNFIMTVKNRQEPILYVSVWYVLAGTILTACTFAWAT